MFDSRFQKVFGFRPTKRPELKKVEQGAVDDKLQSLASDFRRLDTEQRRMAGVGFSKPLGVTFDAALRLRAEELKKLERNLQGAKEAFWNAWDIAQKEGYSVQPSYFDYVPMHLLQR